ncbi:MAG TPA: MFS transporter [Ktedonobacterales bacterium]|nr:MFS transporter [Ktedonobacterales bacterium]
MIEDRQDDTAKDTPEISESAPARKASGALARGKWMQNAKVVFWLMFTINAVNYLDRLIVVAVGPALKADFNLRDSQIGILSSAFILVYAVAALPCGLLADRFSRTRVITFGVSLWSLMSAATAFVRSFPLLFFTRAMVGVGEASYYPAGSALLGAYYPLKKRARIMSGWQSGQLVGMVLAFAIVALLDSIIDPAREPWRLAFFITGIPGLILALFIWFVKDKPDVSVESSQELESDGAEHVDDAHVDAHGAALSLSGGFGAMMQSVGTVLRIRTIWVVVALQALMFIVVTPAITFLPIYVHSENGPFHLKSNTTALVAGAIIVIGGVSGILLGGVLADKMSARFRGGRVLAVSIGFGLAIPFYALALLTSSLPLFILFGIIAVMALNLPVGPLVAALTDATPPLLRATAFAVALSLAHLLGDVWAPYLVGGISTGLHEHANLALLIVGLPCLAIAAIAAFFGARIYSSDVAKQAHQKV